MSWKHAVVCFSILLCAIVANAWETDSNIVSDSTYPPADAEKGFLQAPHLGDALDNAAGTIKAAAYWASNTDGCHVVYSLKDITTGVWNREILESFPNNSTNGCKPGFIKLALAPTGEVIIAYGYARADLSNEAPTAADLHIILKYKNSSGWQGTTDILNYSFPTPSVLTTAHAYFMPEGAISCEPDGSIDIIYTYLNWANDVETLTTKTFNGPGPSGAFGSGTTSVISTSTFGTAAFTTAATVFHASVPSTIGPRYFLLKSTTPSDVGLTSIDYLTNVTSETETELFPVLDVLESNFGVEINTSAVDKIESIIRTICDIQPTSSSSLTKVATVASTMGLPICASIDNTGACTIAYMEPVSNTIHLAAELESVSPIWMNTAVVGPNGNALGVTKAETGDLTSLTLPVNLSLGSTLKLLTLKYIPTTDETHPSLTMNVGTKTGAYSWTWTPDYYVTSSSSQQMCPHLAPYGSFVIHTSSSGNIVASAP